jgi:hypothetical protein
MMRWLPVLLALAAAPASAQRLALETLIDVEGWKTDGGSRLLARNAGDPMGVGRLTAWAAVNPIAPLTLLAIGEVEATTGEEDAKAGLDLLALRVEIGGATTIEAGKILYPVGGFGRRRFSNVNPLIGFPDLYPPLYPYGAVLAGVTGRVDYRLGAVSLPLANLNYTPEPSHRLRPVAGIGYSFGPDLRLAAAVTHGAYLGSSVDEALPAGTTWQDFTQTIAALELRYSRGYLETWAEAAWSSYEVPLNDDPLRGIGAFAEMRLTHSPRVFTALRLEYFDYPFIRPGTPTRWTTNVTTQMNGEIAVGYRLNANTLAKLAYRRDYWPQDPGPNAPPAPDGYALAAQVGVTTDIIGLFARRY